MVILRRFVVAPFTFGEESAGGQRLAGRTPAAGFHAFAANGLAIPAELQQAVGLEILEHAVFRLPFKRQLEFAGLAQQSLGVIEDRKQELPVMPNVVAANIGRIEVFIGLKE